MSVSCLRQSLPLGQRRRLRGATRAATPAQFAAVAFPDAAEAVEEERGSLSGLTTWLDTANDGSAKRLQTQIAEVAKDTTVIRSLDWDRARFDIEFGLSVRQSSPELRQSCARAASLVRSCATSLTLPSPRMEPRTTAT